MPEKTDDKKIHIGELIIDLVVRRAFVTENDLHLSRTEYAIITVLAHRLDAIVTHDELLVQVLGQEYPGANDYLYTHLGRLHKNHAEFNDLLETLPGMGYNLQSKKIFLQLRYITKAVKNQATLVVSRE